MYGIIVTFFLGIYKTCAHYDISVVLVLIDFIGLVIELNEKTFYSYSYSYQIFSFMQFVLFQKKE